MGETTLISSLMTLEMTATRPASVAEDGIRIDLGTGNCLQVTVGGKPAVLAPGWEPAFVYTKFLPFLLLELRHKSGKAATWILSADARRLATTVAELTVLDREKLRTELQKVLPDLIHNALVKVVPNIGADLCEFFNLSSIIRGDMQALCDPLHVLTTTTTCKDIPVPGTALTIPAAGLSACISVDLQGRYIAACRNGRMSWPSLLDGQELDIVHGLVLSPLIMVWRCVDLRHDLVFFVVAAGFDQETAAIYVPACNLLVMRPKTRLTQITLQPTALLGLLANHILEHGDVLLPYLANIPQRLAHFTWPAGAAHIGHYLWNEMPGLEKIVDQLASKHYPLIYDLGGAGNASFYGPLNILYPELGDLVERRFATLPSMLRHAYKHGIQILRFSGDFVSAEIRKRISNMVAGAPELERARKTLWLGTGPVVVFGLRVENRTLTNLIEFYITVAKRIIAEFGSVTLIIDGHNSRNADDKETTFASFLEHRASRRPIDVEHEIVEAIKAGLRSTAATIIDCVGMTMLDNLAWLSCAHYCIAPWGAGLAKFRWVCNLPSYVLLSQACLKYKNDIHIYDSPKFVEAPTTQTLVPASFVIDRPEVAVLVSMDPIHVPAYINYDVDSAPAADAICEELKRIGMQQSWPRRRPHADFDIRGDVIVGQSTELFLASGGHYVLDHVLGYRVPLNSSVISFGENIAGRAAASAAIGASYRHIIFPDKQSVLPVIFGVPEAKCLGAHYAERCADVWQNVIYPRDLLRSHPDDCYLHTDTHMTHKGTLKVVRAVVEELLGAECDSVLREMDAAIDQYRTYIGDLGRKLAAPREETQWLLRVNPSIKRYSNNLSTGNTGAMSIFLLPNAPRHERLVVFGDSFGYDMSLFMAHIFREVTFVRTSYFHFDVIDMIRPDIVLSENVERYLRYVTPDSERPHFALMNTMVHEEDPTRREFARALSAICSFDRRPYRRLLDNLMFGTGSL